MGVFVISWLSAITKTPKERFCFENAEAPPMGRFRASQIKSNQIEQ